MGFNEIKYVISVFQILIAEIHKYTHTRENMLKRPYMCYIFKCMGFKHIKYDIPMACPPI